MSKGVKITPDCGDIESKWDAVKTHNFQKII